MLRPVSRRVLIRKLRNLGFIGPFQGGRHQFMQKGKFRFVIPNVHGNDDIGITLLKVILKQTGISEEEFTNL